MSYSQSWRIRIFQWHNEPILLAASELIYFSKFFSCFTLNIGSVILFFSEMLPVCMLEFLCQSFKSNTNSLILYTNSNIILFYLLAVLFYFPQSRNSTVYLQQKILFLMYLEFSLISGMSFCSSPPIFFVNLVNSCFKIFQHFVHFYS